VKKQDWRQIKAEAACYIYQLFFSFIFELTCKNTSNIFTSNLHKQQQQKMEIENLVMELNFKETKTEKRQGV